MTELASLGLWSTQVQGLLRRISSGTGVSKGQPHAQPAIMLAADESTAVEMAFKQLCEDRGDC